MSPFRLSILVIAILALSACSIFRNGAAERRAKEAEDKAGRITMVLGDPELEADPALAATPIVLPEPDTTMSWPQAGRQSSKLVGHLEAAAKLRVAWRSNAGRGSDNKSALTTAPIASETTAYTIDAEQEIRAFNLQNGRTVWRKKLDSGSRRDKIGYGGGLALQGDTLVVASGYGFVAALDAANGDQKWRREMDAPMTGAPTIKDSRVFVSSNNNEVFALNLSDGAIIWTDQAIAEPARVLGSPSPAAIEDIVVAPYSSGEVIAYLASNGRRLWTDALARPGRFTPISAINDIAGRPVLASGLVFVANQSGVTLAIDGRSGSRVWAQPIGSTQAPALVGDTIYLVSVDGRLACLSASTGGVYWIKQLRRFKDEEDQKGRISYSGPIVASGRVIVISSRGDLEAYDPQTGEKVGELDLGDNVYLEPIAAGGKLLVLNDDATLIAVE